MALYKVNTAVSGDTVTSLLGRIEFKFSEGEHRPRSEEQEQALRTLVDMGLAELVEADEPRDPSEPISPPSLDSLTKPELVAMASARNLDTTGTKAELAARIEAADKEARS